jgi:hypothetical protein
MKTNILVTATALSDRDLLARLEVLASKEREASAELVAHLAALDSRPALYAAQGYGSLFTYCTQALRLSEDAACNRIEAARACRRFPLILDLLASGSLTLTSVRLLGRHLTAENHESVLAKARDRRLREIEALVAELAPRPDLPSAVRKLPSPKTTPRPSAGPGPAMRQVQVAPDSQANISVPSRRTLRSPLRPQRCRPRLARSSRPGRPSATACSSTSVRRPTRSCGGCRRFSAVRSPTAIPARSSTAPSRHVPREVKRAVWERDAGQCAFVSPTGRRCTERTFLEFHHIQPYAMQGPATVANISVRCWRHNQYEAELIFGATGPSIVREGCASP